MKRWIFVAMAQVACLSFMGCPETGTCEAQTTFDAYIAGVDCDGDTCPKACQRELDEIDCIDDDQTPCLVDFQMLGQSKDASTIVTFEFGFIDEDRDFSDGDLVIYVGGERKDDFGIDLVDLFKQRGIELDSDRGVLDFSVELSAKNIESGSIFTIGIRLVDGAGNQSALQEITLEFDL